MPDLPIAPPGDPRLSELQAHARALGGVLRVELVLDGDEREPIGFISMAALPASELSEER